MFPRRSLVPSNLFFLFEEDGGAGGAGGDGGAGNGPGTEETPKTFTQADLDRIVQDRVAREAKKYEGFDDLKTKAEQFDQLQAANQTEAQRLAAQVAAAEAAAETAKQEGASALEKAHTTLKRAELTAAATAAGISVPAAAVALLGADAAFKEHMEKVTVGDDGQVTGAAEAITALVEAQPNLVGSTPRPGGGDGGARPPAPTKTLDEQIAEASEKGDWQAVNRLNAQKLAALQATT